MKAGETERRRRPRHRPSRRSPPIKYEPNGYLFGLDYDVTMIFHPVQKQVGLAQKGQPDKMGNLFREEMIEKAQQGRRHHQILLGKARRQSGRRRLPQGQPTARPMNPGRVVVGTGVYIDDLQLKINAMIWKAVMIGGSRRRCSA